MKEYAEKISVIIPVFNAVHTLEKCVHSVLKQTYDNIEIILVNDGSTDESLKLIQKLRTKDNRIQYVSIDNSGVSCARNIGIDMARGEYLVFADADDYMDETMLLKLYEAIRRIQADVAVCTYTVGTEEKHGVLDAVNRIDKPDMIKELMLPERKMAAFVWNRLYKASIVKNNGIRFNTKVKVCEDTLFNYEVLKYCREVAVVDEPLYHYNINNDSAMFRRGFNQNKLTANIAFKCMLQETQGREEHTWIEVACMLYHEILLSQVCKYRYKLSKTDKEMIKQMLRLNPWGFMKSGVKMKYKAAYIFLAVFGG